MLSQYGVDRFIEQHIRSIFKSSSLCIIQDHHIENSAVLCIYTDSTAAQFVIQPKKGKISSINDQMAMGAANRCGLDFPWVWE